MTLIRKVSIVAQDATARNVEDVMNVESARRRELARNAGRKKKRKSAALTKSAWVKT